MKTRKIICSGLLILILLLVVSLSNAQEYGRLDLEKLDSYINNAYQEWEIPGMAIAIVKDNEVIFEKAYGVKDTQTRKAVNTSTIFGIASNTKAMTAAALAILVDEGKISWDDPVQKYLPTFQLYKPYVSMNMTIRDLLCHRSGLKTFSGDLLWYGSNHSRDEVIRRASYLEPTYDFRSGYGYSNIMFLTAGQIIPVVTGKSWDDFIKEKFFDPLGMVNSSTSIKTFNKSTDKVMGHSKVEGKMHPVPWVDWDNIAPAGSVNSSVKEMSKWIMLQLGRGTYQDKEFFSRSSSIEMWTVNNPFKVSEASMKLWPSKHFSGYGLGWSLYDYHGKLVVAHGGGLEGQISRVLLVPEENIGMVILTNSINSLPGYLAYEIMDRYFGAPENDWSSFGLNRASKRKEAYNQRIQKDIENRIPNTQASLPLESFTGIYGGEMYGNAKVSLENGQLVVDLLPTPIYKGDLTHWHFNTFQIILQDMPSLPPGKVQFLLDADGKVSELKIDIPNPDFDFTELKFLKKK